MVIGGGPICGSVFLSSLFSSSLMRFAGRAMGSLSSAIVIAAA